MPKQRKSSSVYSNTLGLGTTTGILNISLIQRDKKNTSDPDKTNLSNRYMTVDLLLVSPGE